MSQASASSASICAEQNARPTDQPASDQATDQSAVNRAILLSLDRLNDNFACFSQQYDNELVDSESGLLEEQRISQDQAKAIMKRHNTPENVQLRLPKCEPTIWNEIPGKARSIDLKFQTTQAALLGAINCQLDVANSLLSANVSKDVLTSCLDGITLP